MRVLFLTLYPEAAASPRYRVHQFLPHLREAGVDCDALSAVSPDVWNRYNTPNPPRARGYHVHEFSRRMRQIPAARDYDVVFLQKAIMSVYVRGMDRLLRGCSRRLIYDVDDAMRVAPPSRLRKPYSVIQDLGQARRIMRLAECTLAGNHWLKTRVDDAGGRGIYFPTVIDTDRFVPADTPPETFTVGWIGNNSTAANLRMVWPVLKFLPDARVLLIGADKAHLPKGSDRFAVKTWSLDEEVCDVQAMSVGLMPLDDQIWNRGKCALKALQYMACGVPCVASRFGAAKDVITHGENGLLCASDKEWTAALERLRDAGERARMGEAARESVVKYFSLSSAHPKLREILEQHA